MSELRDFRLRDAPEGALVLLGRDISLGEVSGERLQDAQELTNTDARVAIPAPIDGREKRSKDVWHKCLAERTARRCLQVRELQFINAE